MKWSFRFLKNVFIMQCFAVRSISIFMQRFYVIELCINRIILQSQISNYFLSSFSSYFDIVFS